MRVAVKSGSLDKEAVDAIILLLHEGERELQGAAAALDKALDGAIASLLRDGEFSGKAKQHTMLHARGRLKAKKVILSGLGRADKLTLDGVRQAAGSAATYARDQSAKTLATTVAGLDRDRLAPAEAAQAAVEGMLLALYRFDKYKTEANEPKEVTAITFVEGSRERAKTVQHGVEIGRILAESANFARDLVNHPANDMTPTILAEQAQQMAKACGLQCEILDRKDMEKLGMGLLLGVAQGSEQPPKFIILEYRGGKRNQGRIVFVGKGITFDSGGISLKPAEHMHYMRHDKSGAAAVVGFMQAARTLELPVEAIGIFAATENMPSGSAYRPGDVIRSRSGKTMEILNTDAEGRVILSDALTYAVEQEPDAIVDLATLTGACVVALGHVASGLFSNDEQLTALLRQAGEVSGERVWPMPMWPEYGDLIKSHIADIKNVGGRAAGAITAAWFLRHFVQDRPWAHLDIAGTAWTESAWGELPPYLLKDAATGVGVRLLVHFVRQWTA